MAEAVGEGGEAERKVMVAIDESEHSYYALMWFLDNLEESISKFPLIIFMAQPVTDYNYPLPPSLSSAGLYCSVVASDFVNLAQENRRKLALAYLEKAKDICSNKGIEAETVTEVGDPKTAICNAVQKFNINLLVLGDR